MTCGWEYAVEGKWIRGHLYSAAIKLRIRVITVHSWAQLWQNAPLSQGCCKVLIIIEGKPVYLTLFLPAKGWNLFPLLLRPYRESQWGTLLAFLRPVYIHNLFSSHLHIYLVSLTRVMLFNCCNFSFNSFHNKLLTPCYIFAAITLFLYSLLLLLFSLIFFPSLCLSRMMQGTQIMFSGYDTLECKQ